MRPRVPLIAKLAKAVDMTEADLAASLAVWPSDGFQPCWFGSAKVFHDGKPRSTLRLMVQEATGTELPSAEKLRNKLCPGYRCVNPHHYRPVRVQGWEEKMGLRTAPLSLSDLAEADLPPPETDEDIIIDLMDLIDGEKALRHQQVDDLYERFLYSYPQNLIRIALERVNARAADNAW